jgi:antitoxin (DNA-binding transcriptional repressor) of toxin-antitoxin stability system
MFHGLLMKTVAVRQLRQSWPEVEALLKREGELFVTRDGVKVARLAHVKAKKVRRARFSARAHLAWVRSVYGRRSIRSVDTLLELDRSDG